MARPDRRSAEVCFNTAMTGYEEILTDPSYAGQIITFTFPHIGNVGTNRRRHREREHRGAARGLRRHSAQRDHLAVELPLGRAPRCLAQGARRDRHVRHRHPGADLADPREGHAQRGDRARAVRQVRHREAQEGSARMAGPGRHGPGAEGDERPALHLGRDAVGLGEGLRQAGEAGIPCRRDRLRHQAQHPAAARGRRLQGDGGAGQDFGRGHHGAQARRRVPVERPGRSGGDR